MTTGKHGIARFRTEPGVTPAKEKTIMSCALCQVTKEEQLAIRDEMLRQIAAIASPERDNEDSVALIKEVIALYDRLEKGELHNVSAGPVADAAVLAIHKITTPMATAYLPSE
jgi:hypothetical protein